MIDTILFDFDGTLLDSNQLIKSTLNEAALKYRGTAITEDEFQDILGKPLAVQMAYLCDDQVEEMVDIYRESYRSRMTDEQVLFDGIKEMLIELYEAGYKMGIVSNKGSNGINHVLEQFDIGKYFKVSVSQDDVEKRKPDPECVDKALKVIGSGRINTVLVGDSVHDIKCGKNAKIPTILVDWTILNEKQFEECQPDFRLMAPEELSDLLYELNAKMAVLNF